MNKKEKVWIIVSKNNDAYVDFRYTRKSMIEKHCLDLGIETNGRPDWKKAKAKGDRVIKAVLSYSI